ncbi:MAG: hypothetical protein PHF57_01020 [Methanoregula sp.]|nr:hypothetical protein [Methanoregula sp.]
MRQGHIVLGTSMILFILLCACTVSAAPANAGTDVNSQVSGNDSVTGEWKGSTSTRDYQHIEYSIDCYPGGDVEVDIDRYMGQGRDQDMTYFGTWTKAAETGTFRISTAHGSSDTLTLTTPTQATLTTPDGGSVKMYLTERYYERSTYYPTPTYAPQTRTAPPPDYRHYDDDYYEDRYDRDWDDRYDYDDYYDWD